MAYDRVVTSSAAGSAMSEVPAVVADVDTRLDALYAALVTASRALLATAAMLNEIVEMPGTRV